MAKPDLGVVVRRLRYVAGAAQDELTDSQLLRLFVTSRDEAAFTTLVRRHGGLVWGVCRHLLGNEQDAEDAFQSTFLVLARKADAIRKHESLGSFLYGVAYRVALKARCRAARNQQRERCGTVSRPPHVVARSPDRATLPGPVAEVALRELQGILDDEVCRLPEKLRAPFVLCCLEGRSKVEAARELGWKEGTVSGRLALAREKLRSRLLRRGVALSAALTTAALTYEAAAATVPARLADAAVAGLIPGKASTAVATLAERVMQAMFLKQVRVLVVLLAAVVLTTGAGLMAFGAFRARPDADPAPVAPPPERKTETSPAPKKSDLAPQPEPGVPAARLDAIGDPLPPGALMRFGSQRLRHGDIVTAVAYGPGGKFVAAAGNDRSIRLWDPDSGKELARLNRHTGYVYSIALTPDGKTLASAGQDGLICLWDLAAAEKPGTKPRELNGPRDAVVHTVAFSPDGKVLASGGHDGIIRLWDPLTGREVQKLGDGKSRVLRLAFLPDGKSLAAVHSSGEPGKTVSQIILWDVAAGQQIRQIGKDLKEVYGLAVSPDGLTLATGSHQGPKVWEVASGSPVAHLRFPLGGYTPCVIFSPDGNRLLAGGAGFLREWNVVTGRPGRSFNVGGTYIYAAAIAPDGKTLVTGGTRSVAFWDLAKASPRHTFAGHQGEVGGFVFLPGGKELLTGGYDRPIYRWDIATGRLLGQFDGPSRDWNSRLALSPDGKLLAALGPNLSVSLLDTATGKERLKFVKHLPPRISGHAPMDVLFSPDGETVISCTEGIDNTIRIWTAATGQELRVIKLGEKRGAGSLAISPDGKTLYSTNWDGNVHVWDVATGKDLRQFETPGRAIARLALSPDGRHLACAAGTTVLVWDTDTGRELCRLDGHKGWHTWAVFAPDGRTVATAGEENDQVRFWEIATGRVRFTLSGHGGAVKGLAFAPGGRLFVTGSSDTTALLWDYWGLSLAAEQPVAELSPQQLDGVLKDLAGDDVPAAFRAVGRLVRSPKQAVAFLGERLRAAEPERIEKLIAQLDDDVFEMREKATRELVQMGREAEAAVRKATEEGASAEIRVRAQEILSKLEKGGIGPGPRLRALRSLEALEAIGTPEVRRILAELARGRPEAELTREAKAALARLGRRG